MCPGAAGSRDDVAAQQATAESNPTAFKIGRRGSEREELIGRRPKPKSARIQHRHHRRDNDDSMTVAFADEAPTRSGVLRKGDRQFWEDATVGTFEGPMHPEDMRRKRTPWLINAGNPVLNPAALALGRLRRWKIWAGYHHPGKRFSCLGRKNASKIARAVSGE